MGFSSFSSVLTPQGFQFELYLHHLQHPLGLEQCRGGRSQCLSSPLRAGIRWGRGRQVLGCCFSSTVYFDPYWWLLGCYWASQHLEQPCCPWGWRLCLSRDRDLQQTLLTPAGSGQLIPACAELQTPNQTQSCGAEQLQPQEVTP